MGPISSVSHVCLMAHVLSTMVLYIYILPGIFIVSKGKVNLATVNASWLEAEVLMFL